MGKPGGNDSRSQGRTQCNGLEWHYVLVGTIYKGTKDGPGCNNQGTTVDEKIDIYIQRTTDNNTKKNKTCIRAKRGRNGYKNRQEKKYRRPRK